MVYKLLTLVPHIQPPPSPMLYWCCHWLFGRVWWCRARNTKKCSLHIIPWKWHVWEPPYVHWCCRHRRHAGSWPCHTSTPQHLPTFSVWFPRTVQRLAIQQVHVRWAHPRSGPHLSARLPLSARIPWDLRLHTTQPLPGALQAGYVLRGAVGCHTNRGEGGNIRKYRQYYKEGITGLIGVGHRFLRCCVTDPRSNTYRGFCFVLKQLKVVWSSLINFIHFVISCFCF